MNSWSNGPRLKLSPAKAGRIFNAEMTVIRSDFDSWLTEGKVTCKAKLGGKTLAGRGAYFNEGVACSWRLPTNAGGKRLTGSRTVTYQGASANRTLSVRVRK